MTLTPSTVLITAIPGGLALVGWKYARLPWVRDCLMLLGVILLCFAVAVLLVWLAERYVDMWCTVRDKGDRTYQHMMAGRNLDEAVLKYIVEAAHIGISRDLKGETYLHGTSAPLWFVGEFLSASYVYWLCPIRNYSDGSDKRRWAQEITAVLIGAGYASEAIGNQSAAWQQGITPDVIAHKLGISIRANSPSKGGWLPIPGNAG